MIPYEQQVFYFTHAITGPIPEIHLLQLSAWEFLAVKTKGSLPPRANPQAAVKPALRIILFHRMTAMAGVAPAQVGFAYSAIHSAGGN